MSSRARTDRVITLLFAPETRGDFAQQLILFLPPRFQCPREDLLKMIAVVHGGVKENNAAFVGARRIQVRERDGACAPQHGERKQKAR